ncbi:hypothetical protein [Chryseobacterium balustinum]|nr:hypothetical protein [Chryseobacterium balustinum]
MENLDIKGQLTNDLKEILLSHYNFFVETNYNYEQLVLRIKNVIESDSVSLDINFLNGLYIPYNNLFWNYYEYLIENIFNNLISDLCNVSEDEIISDNEEENMVDHHTDNSTIGDGYHTILPNINRNVVNGEKKNTDYGDVMIFGFYSREANANFSKRFNHISEKKSYKSKKVDKNIEIKREGLNLQLAQLYKNRPLPKVFVIAEGDYFEKKIEFEGNTYYLVCSSEGKNVNNVSISVQNLYAYVLEDSRDTFCIKEVVLTPDKTFKALAIDYEFDGINYQTLAVHIPNKLVGEAHSILMKYSEEQYKKKIIVTSYFGDTNYLKQKQFNSCPSIGGHLNLNGEYDKPHASTAKKFTNFMQSVSLLSSNIPEVKILQPSMLNHIKLIQQESYNEGIDHPSINHYVLHVDFCSHDEFLDTEMRNQ